MGLMVIYNHFYFISLIEKLPWCIVKFILLSWKHLLKYLTGISIS